MIIDQKVSKQRATEIYFYMYYNFESYRQLLRKNILAIRFQNWPVISIKLLLCLLAWWRVHQFFLLVAIDTETFIIIISLVNMIML